MILTIYQTLYLKVLSASNYKASNKSKTIHTKLPIRVRIITSIKKMTTTKTFSICVRTFKISRKNKKKTEVVAAVIINEYYTAKKTSANEIQQNFNLISLLIIIY